MRLSGWTGGGLGPEGAGIAGALLLRVPCVTCWQHSDNSCIMSLLTASFYLPFFTRCARAQACFTRPDPSFQSPSILSSRSNAAASDLKAAVEPPSSRCHFFVFFRMCRYLVVSASVARRSHCPAIPLPFVAFIACHVSNYWFILSSPHAFLPISSAPFKTPSCYNPRKNRDTETACPVNRIRRAQARNPHKIDRL